MDYKEEINKAAKHYGSHATSLDDYGKLSYQLAWERGALSDEAKAYWYNEFKQSFLSKKRSIGFTTLMQDIVNKQTRQMIFGTGDGTTDEENELWQKQVVEPTYTEEELKQNESISKYFAKKIIDGSDDWNIEWNKYQEYLKDNPDRPISFDNWKYMIEHYPTELWTDLADKYLKYKFVHTDCNWTFEQWKDAYNLCNGDEERMKSIILIKPWIDCNELNAEINNVQGKRPHYPYGTIQSDPLYGATKKDFDDATPKRIGIIGHVDHGKSITGKIIIVGETGVDDRMVASAHNIQSIVPIADVIPEQILSKQEFLEMHDKAVERSITDETYKESRAWDIKKEKKVSHKRNNKRK